MHLSDPTHPLFGALTLLVDEVELERAVARFGYHKDNAFSEASLEERLRDECYVRALIETGRAHLDEARQEQWEEEEEALTSLLRELARLSVMARP